MLGLLPVSGFLGLGLGLAGWLPGNWKEKMRLAAFPLTANCDPNTGREKTRVSSSYSSEFLIPVRWGLFLFKSQAKTETNRRVA